MHILIVEDDTVAAEFLVKGLSELGHVVDHAADGLTGLDRALGTQPDALIVDCMLPELDGIAMVRQLRAKKIDTPVLFLSALREVDHRVRGLEAGGDDYVVKPYAFAEVRARLDALVRRHSSEVTASTLRLSDLELDRLKRTVMRAGKPIDLQPREFRMLEFLLENAGQVVTRTMLLEKVWGYHFEPKTRVIDVHISRLRAKIDRGFSEPLLQTIRGAGYSLRSSGTSG
ncbi:MAG: response regulator transcription factor [Rhodospirillales bacterium]|nr:response regulator transcription factor [Rhodospirillales bacterium]MCY4097737.1 response regulator transcription factor [Rhodospirillales bacterium]MDE0373517.1 response regulator transcription factor [Rhodospirillales bacterium]MXX23787.1 response regulator transcription factor [Rhodospirillales bacterium]MYE18787.1 response regulator transcription factor [Rhodospirillales bacterium]